jgi:hypothetical protein
VAVVSSADPPHAPTTNNVLTQRTKRCPGMNSPPNILVVTIY